MPALSCWKGAIEEMNSEVFFCLYVLYILYIYIGTVRGRRGYAAVQVHQRRDLQLRGEWTDVLQRVH